MFVHQKSAIRIAIIIASVALAFPLAGGLSVSSVAAAAEEVPAVAQVAAEDLNEQPQGDEALPRPSQPQIMNGDGDFWNGWWVIMPIMMVLFWGGVIALVVWGVRQFTQNNGREGNPVDIAKERLAKGEITKDEFEAIRGNLA